MGNKTIKKEAPLEETSAITVTEKEDKVKVVTPLKDLIEAYTQADQQIKVIDDGYKTAVTPYKQAKEAIKAEIIQVFKDRGEYSARFDKATASLAVRKSVVITNEADAIKHLKDTGMTDYVSESLNDLFHDSLSKLIAKGEAVIPGTEIKETEYLTVRTNDKPDARKITTEKFVQVGKE